MPEVQTDVRPLSQWERVGDAFVSPSETFRDVRRSTSWWLPVLLITLFSLGLAVSVERRVGWSQVVENQLHANPAQESQLSDMDPAARATRARTMVAAYQYMTYASPAIVLAAGALGALGLWASFNFGLGAQTTFAQMFCVWMYAALPRALAALIAIVTLWFGGSPEGFDLRQPAGTNPGYYLTDAAAWLRTLLSFFDVLGIWSLVLLILGCAIVAKVKTGAAAAVVLGWWVLILLITVGATAAFS
jgi:hypothetical protein